MVPRAPLSLIACKSGIPLAKKIVKSLSKRTTREGKEVGSKEDSCCLYIGSV